MPPTSSATICTSGCATTSRQSVVLNTWPSAAGNLLGVHRAAAHRDHLQAVPELERDLVPVFGQNGQRAGADVAQPDDADVDFLHIHFMISAAASLLSCWGIEGSGRIPSRLDGRP